MAGTGETAQEIWETCAAYGDLVFDVHDQVPWQRDRRLEAYAPRMSTALGDRLSRTLLALRLYAVARATVATAGRPPAREELAGVSLGGLMAEPRRHYELFAGFEAVTPDAVRAHAINVLKLLSYEQPGGALMLVRLDGGIRVTVDRLARRYQAPGLTLRDLMTS